MKVIRSALLPYSAENMYEIVADIEAYPGFLNWCTAAEIVSRQPDEVVARLKIEYSKLNIQFTTRNRVTPAESIALSLVDGPFTDLSGEWRFESLAPEACKVIIEMNFIFDRSLSRSVMAQVFKKTIGMQLDAFQKRAQQLHGKPGIGYDTA